MLARVFSVLVASHLAGAALSGDVEIETALGPAVVPEQPASIVVLDVAAVDTLNALGIPIVGTLGSLYVNYLDDVAKDAADVGTFFEPDLEAIHALDPDLIIVGTRSSEYREPLSAIAPTVDMTVWRDVIGEALVRLQTYGQVFAVPDRAEAVEAEFKALLDEAAAAVKDKGKGLVIMLNGPKISAYGANGRFGWLHSATGLAQAAPDIAESIHGEAISFEFIRETDPDWLVVIDRQAAIGQPGDGAVATLDNVIMHGTRAWTSGQVIYLDAADIYIAGGGVQSIMRTLKTLISGFSAS